jgi:hypothetical protein
MKFHVINELEYEDNANDDAFYSETPQEIGFHITIFNDSHISFHNQRQIFSEKKKMKIKNNHVDFCIQPYSS